MSAEREQIRKEVKETLSFIPSFVDDEPHHPGAPQVDVEVAKAIVNFMIGKAELRKEGRR